MPLGDPSPKAVGLTLEDPLEALEDPPGAKAHISPSMGPSLWHRRVPPHRAVEP